VVITHVGDGGCCYEPSWGSWLLEAIVRWLLLWLITRCSFRLIDQWWWWWPIDDNETNWPLQSPVGVTVLLPHSCYPLHPTHTLPAQLGPDQWLTVDSLPRWPVGDCWLSQDWPIGDWLLVDQLMPNWKLMMMTSEKNWWLCNWWWFDIPANDWADDLTWENETIYNQ